MEQRKSYSVSEQKAIYTEKQDDKIAKTMSMLNQRRQQSREEEEIFQILSKPRSKKYIELVKKNIQLNQRLRELEARKQELPQKTAQETETGWWEAKEEAPAEPEQESEKGWWEAKEEASAEPEQESEMGWWKVKKEAPAEPKQESEKGWWEVKEEASAEPEQAFDNSQIEEEIEREMAQIQQEIEELGRELAQEMPMCSRGLGFIYSLLKQQELINQGVISAPGTPFFSLPQLLDLVQAQTEQEKKQWTTGNQAYHDNYGESLLVVEIYLSAVCVVWDDGSVKCYRD